MKYQILLLYIFILSVSSHAQDLSDIVENFHVSLEGGLKLDYMVGPAVKDITNSLEQSDEILGNGHQISGYALPYPALMFYRSDQRRNTCHGL